MGMKLQFDASLEYQQVAIQSIVGLFDGQQRRVSEFTVAPDLLLSRIDETASGIGNRLEISKEDILENLRKIQLNNGLISRWRQVQARHMFTFGPCWNFIKCMDL